jgi:hypothetical protein
VLSVRAVKLKKHLGRSVSKLYAKAVVVNWLELGSIRGRHPATSDEVKLLSSEHGTSDTRVESYRRQICAVQKDAAFRIEICPIDFFGGSNEYSSDVAVKGCDRLGDDKTLDHNQEGASSGLLR